MKKIYMIVIILGLLLFVGGLFFLLHHKKLFSSDVVTDNCVNEKVKGLELYQNENGKEAISKQFIKDSTGLCADSEIQVINNTVNMFEDEFLRNLLTYDGSNSEYLSQIQSYYADTATYANTNVAFPEQLLNHYNIDEMTTSFQSVNIITVNIREKSDTATVISVRGIINANLISKTISEGNYDCIYRSDILLENEQCKVLNIELSKIFKPGVTSAWEDNEHITVQFKGDFVCNWNIGNEDAYSKDTSVDNTK